MAVFDATRRRHRLGRHERELLEFAALLHDIGHVISYPGHHKHTEYLIRNGDLRGFQPQDIQVIASTARYHRRALPRRQHAGFRKLTPAARTTVEVLAGCLRIADALDRSHRQQVRLANARLRGDRLTLACEAPSDWALEAWGAESRKGLLESALGLQIEVTFSRRRGASAEASRAELASGA
jgi:exopolyphosphatase/guanosine-5'-triphosphate,3'-diphosphate pyrophosphatase